MIPYVLTFLAGAGCGAVALVVWAAGARKSKPEFLKGKAE